jgi:hypothetical protein
MTTFNTSSWDHMPWSPAGFGQEEIHSDGKMVLITPESGSPRVASDAAYKVANRVRCREDAPELRWIAFLDRISTCQGSDEVIISTSGLALTFDRRRLVDLSRAISGYEGPVRWDLVRSWGEGLSAKPDDWMLVIEAPMFRFALMPLNMTTKPVLLAEV